MLRCKVRGACVATIKNRQITGISLISVERLDNAEQLVAADPFGCPPGALVLVASGSAARLALSNPQAPIDHAVVAIVDEE